MLQSHVIEIDGAFVGAAVCLDTGYRFIATDIGSLCSKVRKTTWVDDDFPVYDRSSLICRAWVFRR